MNLHVLHVIDSLCVGGAERMLVDIANATAGEGRRASACITRDGRDLANDLRPEVPLWVLGREKRFDWAAMKQFASIVKEQRVDLLHAHGRSTFSFVALIKTLGLIRTPILLHDHYGQIEIDSSVPLWFRLWGRHHVAQYAGVYAKLGDWAAAAGVPRARIGVVGNALDLVRVQNASPTHLRKEFGVADHERVGIVAAGIRPEKGIAVLLAALASLAGRHALKVIIAGGDRDAAYARACRAQCVSLGLERTAIFAGERADVPGLIKGADFALIPSLSESGPLVLIEYMAGGLPFVATRVGDIAHRVEELGGSEFVPPNDAAAFAAALDRLLSLSASDWQKRSEAGRKTALDHFEIRQVMPHWDRMYRAALQGSGS